MCTKKDYEALAEILRTIRDETILLNEPVAQMMVERVAVGVLEYFWANYQNFSHRKFVETIGVEQ